MSSKWIFTVLLLAAFAVFSKWVIEDLRLPIQADVQKRANAQLKAIDFENVTVLVDGRDVTVTGSVMHAFVKDKASELLHGVWGVRLVNNQLVVVADDVQEANIDLALFNFNADIDSKTLTLSGRVTDVKQHRFLLQHVNAAFAHLTVQDALQVGAQDFPAGNDILVLMLEKLAHLYQGELDVSAEGVHLNGVVIAQQTEEELRQSLQGSSTGLLTLPVRLQLQIAQTLDDDTCVREVNTLVDKERVQFAFGKSRLHKNSSSVLDRVASIIARCQTTIEISGYTDSKGDAGYNQTLSENRAKAVRRYLQDKGIDVIRLQAMGYGEKSPVADNGSKRGRALNRRIEFRLIETET